MTLRSFLGAVPDLFRPPSFRRCSFLGQIRCFPMLSDYIRKLARSPLTVLLRHMAVLFAESAMFLFSKVANVIVFRGFSKLSLSQCRDAISLSTVVKTSEAQPQCVRHIPNDAQHAFAPLYADSLPTAWQLAVTERWLQT